MSQLPYMPMYWSDFFAKTATLTGYAQGMYALLLGRLWQADGVLPDDDRRLAALLGIHLATWRRLKPELVPYLQLGDGLVRQKRVTEEISRAHESVIKRRLHATRAREALAAKRKNKHLEGKQGLSQSLYQSHNHNQTKEKEKKEKESDGNGSAAMAPSPAIGGRYGATPPTPNGGAPPDQLNEDEIAAIAARLSFAKGH